MLLLIFCWQSSIGLQCISLKREIIQPTIYRILPKVNQVIYTLDTIYVSNIQGSIGLQCVSRKREIIQRNIHRISRKVNQVIYTLDTILVSNIMILGPLWVKKGNNSVKCSQNFMKSFSRHLHHVPKLTAWYHDPSSSGSPDILLTMLLNYTKCKSRKREIIQPNIYRILPNVNQVIYTIATVYMPNIISAQAVNLIICWQGAIGLHA